MLLEILQRLKESLFWNIEKITWKYKIYDTLCTQNETNETTSCSEFFRISQLEVCWAIFNAEMSTFWYLFNLVERCLVSFAWLVWHVCPVKEQPPDCPTNPSSQPNQLALLLNWPHKNFQFGCAFSAARDLNKVFVSFDVYGRDRF